MDPLPVLGEPNLQTEGPAFAYGTHRPRYLHLMSSQRLLWNVVVQSYILALGSDSILLIRVRLLYNGGYIMETAKVGEQLAHWSQKTENVKEGSKGKNRES